MAIIWKPSERGHQRQACGNQGPCAGRCRCGLDRTGSSTTPSYRPWTWSQGLRSARSSSGNAGLGCDDESGSGYCETPSGRRPEPVLRTVLMATVKGDLHDIGKNLVTMMLEAPGFKVVDLADLDVQNRRAVKAIRPEILAFPHCSPPPCRRSRSHR